MESRSSKQTGFGSNNPFSNFQASIPTENEEEEVIPFRV